VESLDALTGKRVWVAEYPTLYRDDFGFDEGPRGTPAVAGDRIYTFGAEGVLQALDFATGKRAWSLDFRQKFAADKGFFGAACSPLVEGDRVLMNVGGPNGAGVAAFDAATGKVLWTATNDEAGYSAPVAATIDGVRHALFFTRNALVDIDPATGKVRFTFPWRSRSHAHNWRRTAELAPSAATTRSQLMTTSQAPPQTEPSTIAITGAGCISIIRITRRSGSL